MYAKCGQGKTNIMYLYLAFVLNRDKILGPYYSSGESGELRSDSWGTPSNFSKNAELRNKNFFLKI